MNLFSVCSSGVTVDVELLASIPVRLFKQAKQRLIVMSLEVAFLAIVTPWLTRYEIALCDGSQAK